jgi:transposase-like protein
MERPSKTLFITRTCPACGAADYLFRGRKKIADESGKNEGGTVETKYRCKACGEEWRVRSQANDSA